MPSLIYQNSLNYILDNHRLYQTYPSAAAPPLPSLVERAAQVVGEQPPDILDDVPLHLVPDHLRARIECYTPRTALMRPVRNVVQHDICVWPEAMRQNHSHLYLQSLQHDATDDLEVALHPDALRARSWMQHLFAYRVWFKEEPEQHLAQVDLGRIFLASTARALAKQDSRWARFWRYLDTPHGIDAPRVQPSPLQSNYRAFHRALVDSYRQLWSAIGTEFSQAASTHEVLHGPYMTALRDGAALMALWDYDLLRMSVTQAHANAPLRTPARFLRPLRRALGTASRDEATPDTTRLQLIQLNRYLGIFDIHPALSLGPDSDWRAAGLRQEFKSLGTSVRHARQAETRAEAPHVDAASGLTYDDPGALVALWRASKQWRGGADVGTHIEPVQRADGASNAAPRRRFGQRLSAAFRARV